MNRPGISCVIACLIGCTAAAQLPVDSGSARRGSSEYRVIRVRIDDTVDEPLQKIDALVQVGSSETNRFTMHRVYHRHGSIKGSIILIPSLVNNFNEYMISEKQGRTESLATALARAHYDVYGYSPRTSTLPPHACTAGKADCSVMKDWDINAYVEDVEFIRSQALRNDQKPVVGGLSLGGFVGIGAVNANPSGYSGLLLWEAAPFTKDPAAIAGNTQNCAGVRANIASGVYWEENLRLRSRISPEPEKRRPSRSTVCRSPVFRARPTGSSL